MKKIIYFIPGLGENCSLLRYKKLAEALREKGYKVNCVNPDWYQPLTTQVFDVERDAIVCGFSFGAVLAYLVAKNKPCRKLILASISPIHTFSFKSLEADYRRDVAGKVGKERAKTLGTELAKDIKSIKISLNNLSTPYVLLAGQNETRMPADFLVPKAGHKITPEYIKCICNLV